MTAPGEVVRVGRNNVHVTRIDSGGGLHGHLTTHCDAGGCSGRDRYFPRPVGRPKGRAVTVPVLLPLSPASHTAVTAAAAAAGLTRVEWMRRAVAYCVATRVPLSHE